MVLYIPWHDTVNICIRAFDAVFKYAEYEYGTWVLNNGMKSIPSSKYIWNTYQSPGQRSFVGDWQHSVDSLYDVDFCRLPSRQTK